MKNKKINKSGVTWLIIFNFSLIIIAHDFYRLALEPIFTGKLTALTLLGALTLGIAFICFCESYEQLKKCANEN